METVQAYIETHKERFLEELLDLLRIPSISADPAHVDDVKKAAEAVAQALRSAGIPDVDVFETGGHPIVFAEKKIDPKKPTVLVYGHYDVQPPDPLELWESPPFEPIIKKSSTHPDGAIYARGACDDKGQLFMHVKALEAMLEHDELKCNVKLLLEGEEEVGSQHLAAFCASHKQSLECDVVLISDTSIINNDTPSITSGLRGLCYVEVTVTGANRDLHSGVYGGAVANPINVLSQMVADLHDEKGRITIPGFYDKVIDLSVEERRAMNEAPYDESSYKADLGIEEVMGEHGYTTIERASIRPTLDVNGIWGGYTGEGAKTVLPSEAHAKISMRLVPDQNPDDIVVLFTNFFRSLAPAGVKVEVRPHHHGRPALTPVDSVEYKAASLAMEQTFGKSPIPARGGGSIPIVSLFEEVLGVKSILMGFGLDSDDIHSPNEHYGIFNFYQGIRTIPYFYKFYAELKNGQPT
ncbi:MAG: dipeptidase [Saprospiraceae bacterium]|nr:dipeptidase [Saprospiraceae bacterium]